MNTEIKLHFKSDPRLLEAIRALVRHYLNACGAPEERIQELVLAVDEACANAIRHAYQGDPGALIFLSLGRSEDLIEIVVADTGAPMPKNRRRPTPVAEREETPGPEQVRPGGLGLALIRKAADQVSITSGRIRGNRIRMRVRLK